MYHTHHILAKYHKIVSLQIYLAFQFNDYNVKMDTFWMEKQCPFLYKYNLYHRKLVTTYKTLWHFPGKVLYRLPRWLLGSTTHRNATEVSSRTAVHSLYPIPTSKAAPKKNNVILPTAKNSFCSPKMPVEMDLAQAAHTNQHHACSQWLE